MSQKRKCTFILPILLLVFSIIGLLVSVYLTHLHYADAKDTICDINSKISCTSLAKSTYSKIGPIPISVLGIIGYVLFTTLSVLYLLPDFASKIHKSLSKENILKLILVLVGFSVIFTIYLIIVEIMIQLFCLGCMISWFTTFSIALISYYLFKKERKNC